MIALFLVLTAVNLLFLLITASVGYGVTLGHGDWAGAHQLAGALAAIVCCGVHCVVFTYFAATAKWIRHAISVKQLDPALAEPTRSFKAQAFPAALLSMSTVFVTAVVGAATFSYGLRPVAHHALAIAAVLTNSVAAVIQYRAIARNGALIDRILEQVNATATHAPPAPPASLASPAPPASPASSGKF